MLQGVTQTHTLGYQGESLTTNPLPGGHSSVEPPGPIPNPEVKHTSADGSRTIGPARVGRRQVIIRLSFLIKAEAFLFLHAKTFLRSGDCQSPRAEYRTRTQLQLKQT